GLHADAAVIGGLFPGDGETVGRGRDLRAERAAAGSAQAAYRVAALRRRRFLRSPRRERTTFARTRSRPRTRRRRRRRRRRRKRGAGALRRSDARTTFS